MIREAPQTVFPKLLKLWKISHLVFEKDTDAYARERDEEVRKLAEEAGVTVITKVGRTLYDPDELVRVNGGGPTMSMSAVQKVCTLLRFTERNWRFQPVPCAFRSDCGKTIDVLFGARTQ